MPFRPATRVYKYMRAALADLPEQYARHLDNVEFLVLRTLSPRDRRRLGIGAGTLYGFYEGISLPRRTSGYDRVMPDRILVFYGPLVRDFPDDGTLEDQVRKTVYHEIAHYFGLEESDLHNTRVE